MTEAVPTTSKAARAVVALRGIFILPAQSAFVEGDRIRFLLIPANKLLGGESAFL
jgi:hypothetical protein